jgi:hypothetical protein
VDGHGHEHAAREEARRAAGQAEARRRSDAHDADAPLHVRVHGPEGCGRQDDGERARCPFGSRSCGRGLDVRRVAREECERAAFDGREERSPEGELLGDRGEDRAPHERDHERRLGHGFAEGSRVAPARPGPFACELRQEVRLGDLDGDGRGHHEHGGREHGGEREVPPRGPSRAERLAGTRQRQTRGAEPHERRQHLAEHAVRRQRQRIEQGARKPPPQEVGQKMRDREPQGRNSDQFERLDAPSHLPHFIPGR